MPAFVAAMPKPSLCRDRHQARHLGHRPPVSQFFSTWEGSLELRTFFENPAVPALQKIAKVTVLKGIRQSGSGKGGVVDVNGAVTEIRGI